MRPIVDFTIQDSASIPNDTVVMPQHVIRRATADDYDEVMNIGNFLFGSDPLNYFYQRYIEDPDIRSYVYIIEDEIVAFCSAFLVDEGTTLLYRGARVKVELQGQGLYRKLINHVHEELRKLPDVSFETFTTNFVNYKVNGQRIHASYNLLSTRVRLVFYFRLANVNLPDIKETSCLSELNPKDFMTLIADEETRHFLFPRGIVTVNGITLKLLDSNLRHIFKQEGCVVVSKNENSGYMLTIGTRFPCALGISFVVDIYGRDVVALRHHVIFHLSRVPKGDNFLLQIVLDERISVTEAEEALEGLGLPKSDSPCTKMLEFGRNFK